MIGKSKFLILIFSFLIIFIIVNPILKNLGVISYSVIDMPSWLMSIILVLVIPAGCIAWIIYIEKIIRKILNK